MCARAVEFVGQKQTFISASHVLPEKGCMLHISCCSPFPLHPCTHHRFLPTKHTKILVSLLCICFIFFVSRMYSEILACWTNQRSEMITLCPCKPRLIPKASNTRISISILLYLLHEVGYAQPLTCKYSRKGCHFRIIFNVKKPHLKLLLEIITCPW